MNISELLRQTLIKQPAQQNYLPRVSRHVAEHIVHLEEGYFAFVLRLDGIAFEGVNDNHLVNAFIQLKTLFNTVGKQYGNRLGLWTTLQRQRIELKRRYRFKENFCQQFADHYVRQFTASDYYENLFYISGCLKYEDFDDGLQEAKDLVDIMVKSLQMYDPHILGTYQMEDDGSIPVFSKQPVQTENKPEGREVRDDEEADSFSGSPKPEKSYSADDGVVYSEIYQFFGTLINGGCREHIPLTPTAAYIAIPSADLYFGSDILEIRHPQGRKFATLWDLKDFGTSKVKVFANILTLPCEYTLTQSFVFTDNAEMQHDINKKVSELEGGLDFATDQHDELRLGKGELAAGRMMFGDYSAALTVYGNSPKRAQQNGTEVFTAFLTSGGYRFVQARGSMKSTFFSQWPGYRQRPRIIPKTTTNLATVFGMHTYSQGKSWGNPIGDGSPVMPLKTLSNTLFNLSLHYSKLDQNNLGEQIAGHTLIMGATGTGKTTLETAILAFMMRFDPYLFALDLDRGLEIFIRAVGGTYFTVAEGEPSGLNPFQLPDTPANRMFLYKLVEQCADGATADEMRQIKLAVDTLFSVGFAQRNFSVLLENIPYSADADSLRTRLGRWCRSEDGIYAWCLDNDSNRFDPDEFYRIGLDVTSILKPDYAPTGPVLAYLFYLKEMMAERVAEQGSLLATVVAEFWYAASYEVTADLMKKTLKTGRKLGEYMILDTQSPEDAIACPIFSAIVQQTPTKIFLPNPDAEYDGYKSCGLSDKEFGELVTKAIESRTFLVKQSKQSAFCLLDLYGFDDELAVLSGTMENVEILHRVMEECGSENPDVWYRPFTEAVGHSKRKKRERKTVAEEVKM